MPWHYEHEGVPQGPFSVDKLRRAISVGTVNRRTLVWRQGMTGWQPLEEIADLSGLLRDLPPPVPPPVLPPPVPPPVLPPPVPPPVLPPPVPPPVPDNLVREISEPGEGSIRSREGLRGGLRGLARLGRAHPAVSASLIGALVVVGILCWIYCPGDEIPPDPMVLGRLRVDANPWGQVRWIRGSDRTDVTLPQEQTTPMLATVPVGSYRAEVHYPHASVTKQCTVQVRADGVAVCWVDLDPLDARAYFQKIGW